MLLTQAEAITVAHASIAVVAGESQTVTDLKEREREKSDRERFFWATVWSVASK